MRILWNQSPDHSSWVMGVEDAAKNLPFTPLTTHQTRGYADKAGRALSVIFKQAKEQAAEIREHGDTPSVHVWRDDTGEQSHWFISIKDPDQAGSHTISEGFTDHELALVIARVTAVHVGCAPYEVVGSTLTEI